MHVSPSIHSSKCLGSYHFFKPIQVSDFTELFLRTFPSANQADKGLWNNIPLPVEKSGLSPVCVRLSIPLGSRPVLIQTPHKTFSLRMLPVQAPCQREEKSKTLTDMTVTLSVFYVYTGSSFNNELVQSSVMRRKKRHTKANSWEILRFSYSRKGLVIDSATFLSSEASLLETSLQIKSLT